MPMLFVEIGIIMRLELKPEMILFTLAGAMTK